MTIPTVRICLAVTVAATCLSVSSPRARAESRHDADLVVTDARIYTADSSHPMAEAIAVRDGKIVFIGRSSQAAAWIGPDTKVERLAGRLVIPGLVDSHIHASMISDIDVCDLKSTSHSLREIAAFASHCIEQYAIPEGEWLSVHQWDYSRGNQPDPDYPTLRAALDKVSTKHPIELRGNDGHHNAFNSMALARATNSRGVVVGMSKATLSSDFSEFKSFIGTDANGEPNGAVNEDARLVLNNPDRLLGDLPQVMKAPQRVMERLNSVGITAILDPKAPPGLLPFYDTLQRNGQLTVRVLLAQYYIPELFKTADGSIDYDRMLAMATSIRAKYANNPLIRADAIKLFADGVLEGNPYVSPPTMPNAAVLRPFLQPIFGRDRNGLATVTGYVDTSSALCAEVRANPAKYSSEEDVVRFMAEQGYHPRQCEVTSGRLYHTREVNLEFVRRFHLAGFALHIHAISNQALRTGLDAIEAARKIDGIDRNDVIAHLQLADPSDVVRLGKDHIYVAFTYVWAYAEPEYDVTVIPFIDRVSGNSFATLHRPGNYYDANSYPFRSVLKSGATLVAGSDAPVETPDPRPFVSMSYAVTRSKPGQPVFGPSQRISIRDVLNAYTINGARALGRSSEFGSLEKGKSADFAVLNQDILALADSGRAEDIAQTHVLGTWFQGKKVYSAAP